MWQPLMHTRRMIGVLVDDGFLCRDPACLGAPEWEDLTDNVSAFVKPKNDVKCSFIIDMRNLNDCSKVPLRKVKFLSIHTVFSDHSTGDTPRSTIVAHHLGHIKLLLKPANPGGA